METLNQQSGSELLERVVNDLEAERQDDLHAALRLNPYFYRCYGMLGMCYFRVKDFNAAIAAYRKALNGKEDDTLYSGIGLAYLNLNDVSSALENYSAAIRINPRNDEHYTNRGLVHCKMNNLEEAIADFDSALRLGVKYPTDGDALSYLTFGLGFAFKGIGLDASYNNAGVDLGNIIRISLSYKMASSAPINIKPEDIPTDKQVVEEAINEFDKELGIDPVEESDEEESNDEVEVVE